MGRHEQELTAKARRPTNVSLDMGLVTEARLLGINISRACEMGLIEQIARENGRVWREENVAALASSNSYVDNHGLPLSRHRRF
ncbi:MAG TPA: type II toxin-antitoxin system CcdA family antitoxin [Sphingobium sp.]